LEIIRRNREDAKCGALPCGKEGSSTSQESLLVQVEIAYGFACRRVFSLLHRLFKFLRQDVFFVRFLEPGIRKLVFAAPILFGKDLLGVGKVHVRASFRGWLVRKHSAENRINCELRLRSEEHTSELQSRGHLVCR